MELDNAIKKRRSVRKYSSKKVSMNYIAEICDSARYAPMAGNIFSLKLIIVSDNDKKKKIADACFEQKFIADASCLIVVCSDENLVVKSYEDAGKTFVRQQAGAAIENMLLKITSLGLSSCWIGAFDEKALKKILEIPEKIQIEAVLPVAYASDKTNEKKKPELKMITFFDKWNQKEFKSTKTGIEEE